MASFDMLLSVTMSISPANLTPFQQFLGNCTNLITQVRAIIPQVLPSTPDNHPAKQNLLDSLHAVEEGVSMFTPKNGANFEEEILGYLRKGDLPPQVFSGNSKQPFAYTEEAKKTWLAILSMNNRYKFLDEKFHFPNLLLNQLKQFNHCLPYDEDHSIRYDEIFIDDNEVTIEQSADNQPQELDLNKALVSACCKPYTNSKNFERSLSAMEVQYQELIYGENNDMDCVYRKIKLTAEKLRQFAIFNSFTYHMLEIFTKHKDEAEVTKGLITFLNNCCLEGFLS